MRHVLSIVACAVLAPSLLVARAAPHLPNVADSLKPVVLRTGRFADQTV